MMLDVVLDLNFLSTEMPKEFWAWYVEEGAKLVQIWRVATMEDGIQSACPSFAQQKCTAEVEAVC